MQIEELNKWVYRMRNRFPKRLDSRFIKGLHLLFGCTHSSFLQKRSLFHLKRILLTQFFLEKKRKERKEKEVFLRVFSISSRICIGCIRTYREDTDVLTGKDILDAASELVPSLRQVEYSFYEWNSQDFPGAFCYIELEKMRGATLFPKELTELEEKLQEKIRSHTSSLSIFWPHNHEDAYKQLLVLEKEMRSEKDLPQVSIHFKQQTTKYLEFMIYLVRSKTLLSLETEITADRFPSTMHFFSYVNKEIEMDVPFAAEVFSLGISSKNFIVDYTINLLNARMMIAQLLQDVIGPFRDFNGGLLETQKKQFDHLSERFAKKIPNFPLFGERLFYAIAPIETQISLGMDMLEKLFCAFSAALSEKDSFCCKPNHYVLIFQSQEVHLLSSYFSEARKLEREGKIVAYAKLEFASYHYLCLLDITGENLVDIQNKWQSPLPFTQEKRSNLNLIFEEGEILSFAPYFLAQERRSRVLGKLLFEGLTRLGPSNQVKYASCTEVILSKDNCRYLFKIRPHFWSNGKKVTAFHYEKSWKQNFLKGRNFPFFRLFKNASLIKKNRESIRSLGVKALDKDTLQVDLERRDPFFLRKLTFPIFFPFSNNLAEPESFNGPYLVKKRSDHVLVLEKNPYYWDRKNISFDRIDILFKKFSDEGSLDILKSRTDWIGAPFNWPSSTLPIPFLRRKEPKRAFWIYLNTEFFPLSSPFIRRALSMVIDRKFIAENIFIGGEPLSHQLFSNSSPRPSSDALITKARSYFAQGMKELGLTQETFPAITLSYYYLTRNSELAEYLQKLWIDIFAIQVHLDGRELNRLLPKLERASFEAALFFKPISNYDPFLFLESFSSKENNYSCWSNERYAKKINEWQMCSSKEKKEQFLREIEQIFLDHMPIIPLIKWSYFYAPHPNLKDYTIDEDVEKDIRIAYFSR